MMLPENYDDHFKNPGDSYYFAVWSLGWYNFKQHETVDRWNERHGDKVTISSVEEFYERMPEIIELWKQSKGHSES